MTEVKIKPCPFCGGEATTRVNVIRNEIAGLKDDISFIVGCPTCHVGQCWKIDDCNSFEDVKTAMQKAIERWNRRANDEAD